LEGDHALLDDDVSVAQVVKVQTQVHLPSHTEQLLSLV
jgi:hypothetical protein